MKNKILVTGGKGFIGSHLVDALIKKSHDVSTLDLSKRPIDYPNWDKVKQIKGDILDKKSIEKYISKSDYIFHLAGVLGTSETLENIDNTINQNIIGTLNILNAIKKYHKRGMIITIGGISWLNPYAITKLAAEKFSLMFIKEYGLDIKVVRGLNTYGSRQKHMPVKKAVPNFILNALQNKPIEIYGDGKQILDLVYIDDLVNIMIKAMNSKKIIPYVIDAGTGGKTTVNSLVKTIIKLTKSKSKITYLPMRSGEPEHSVTLADIKTLKEINYLPKTTLIEGLIKTIPWYKNHQKQNQ